MISLINGRVRHISTDRCIVEVGGVGLSLSITPSTSLQLSLGASVQLFTTLVVREDSLTLFGFLDEESRQSFELVQTVSGIGPKVALAIVGAMSSEDLSRAIAQEDIKSLEKVPGIGRKGAQRMILELKGKISDFSHGKTVLPHLPKWHEQLMSALTSLGFTAKDSDEAIKTMASRLAEDGVDPSTVEISDLLRSALQNGRRT